LEIPLFPVVTIVLKPVKLNKVPIEEIRERLLRGDQPITGHILNKLERDPREGARKIYKLLKKRHDKERIDRARIINMLNFERVLWKSGVQAVAGVDEAGTGPLAGPVVAAAVMFPPGTEFAGIDDSKRLDVEQRVKMEDVIRRTATAVGVGLADVGEIDRLNIYHAALLAMRRAVDALTVTPDHLLIDARVIPDVLIPQNSFYKGDGINFSIAAASIIAKTYRDKLMEGLEKTYPGYGFAQHKGYGTAEHQNAIRQMGPCPAHRMSFPIIRELCGEFSEYFYELKQQLSEVDSVVGLRNFEAKLKDCSPKIDEREQRKIRLMLSRRWKTV
jgi:ribonuclease HII